MPTQPARVDIFVGTKPSVALIWLGTLVMTLGDSLAAIRRFIKQATKHKTVEVRIAGEITSALSWLRRIVCGYNHLRSFAFSTLF